MRLPLNVRLLKNNNLSFLRLDMISLLLKRMSKCYDPYCNLEWHDYNSQVVRSMPDKSRD